MCYLQSTPLKTLKQDYLYNLLSHLPGGPTTGGGGLTAASRHGPGWGLPAGEQTQERGTPDSQRGADTRVGLSAGEQTRPGRGGSQRGSRHSRGTPSGEQTETQGRLLRAAWEQTREGGGISVWQNTHDLPLLPFVKLQV